MAELDFTRLKRCACSNIRGTARALTQFYDEVLQPTGLRTTQFSMLVNIVMYEQVTVSELADKLLMDQTTVTRNLKVLKDQGLVESGPGVDKRTRHITITRQGEQTLERMLGLWETAQTHIIEGLGEERFRSLLGELSAVVALTR